MNISARQPSMIVGIVSLLLISGCVSTSKHKELEDQYSKAMREKTALSVQAANLQAKITQMSKKHAKKYLDLKESLERTEREKQRIKEKTAAEKKKLEQTMKEMEQVLTREIKKGAVRIKTMEKKSLQVEFLGKLFFPSGSAELTREARKSIARIVPMLKSPEVQTIRVVGHTDPRPPNPKLKKRFFSNWELSTARANAVVRVLQWGHGIPPEKMISSGVAHYKPVPAGEGRDAGASNRVVDIQLIPGRAQ